MEENNTVMQDLVCELPEEAAIYKKNHGELPSEMIYEPGYICSWDGRYFVHSRVVLPLKAIENGVGFGLWVEISKEDFDKYLAAESDDDKYMAFETRGMLANHWPGFLDTYGLIVTIKAISVTEKIYIVNVEIDRPRDPLFESALLIQDGEQEKIDEVRRLIVEYTQLTAK